MNIDKTDELVLVKKIIELSDENLKSIGRLIEIILNHDELQIERKEDGSHSFILVQHITIPLTTLEREGLGLREADTIIRKINQFSTKDFIKVVNEEFKSFAESVSWNTEKETPVNDEHYTKNLLVMLDNRTPLKEIKKVIDRHSIKTKRVSFLLGENELLPIEEDFEVQSLKYKDGLIFCKHVALSFTPQEKLFCLNLMKNPAYLSDTTIKGLIAVKSVIVSDENMQKIISAVRRKINKVDKKIQIKRVNHSGYKLVVK